MEMLSKFVSFFMHLDKHLDELFTAAGPWTYVVLALIVFCETGLVVTPFLPGDSLLFAAGALTVRVGMNVHQLAVILVLAAIFGDTVNYQVGKFFGPKVFEKKDSKIFRPEYLQRTQKFFDKYGAKTIVIARFVPIVRTFAPFLAGVGTMRYTTFLAYNALGGVAWVVGFLYAGYFFGDLPVVKRNFTLVILAIIVISILPGVIEVWRAKREARADRA